MKPLFLLAIFSTASLLHGQDPTIPSQAIIDRIQSDPAPVVRPESRPIPAIKLRGMVMLDRDQGTAIIEVDDKRLRLILDRSFLKQSSINPESTNALRNIQIQGVEYQVEDFSERTIILSDGLRRVFVQ